MADEKQRDEQQSSQQEGQMDQQELDALVDAYAQKYGSDVDRMLQDLRQELDSDEPDYPQSTPETVQPTEFRDQEYLDTFGDNLPSGFVADGAADETPDDDAMDDILEEEAEEMQIRRPRRRGKRTRKPKKRRSAVVVAFSTVIYIGMVAAVSLLLAKFAWLCADDVLALTKPDEVTTVTIGENATLGEITDALHDADLINYPWLFKIYGNYAHVADRVKAGTYELNRLYDYHAIVNGLSSGEARETVKVTLIEGYSCKQIFQLLADAGVCSVEQLEQAASSGDYSEYWFASDLPKDGANRLEGYLYPDTYEFYTQADAQVVLRKILDNFDAKIDETLRAQVEQSGHSLHEIITVASLIEEEAASEGERADIASVIYNRLASKELPYLQLDSTVYYAAELMGESFDTNLDNPYNTYRYEGLPPGPIDNPGMNSIRAALAPNKTDYYYFAYGTDGVSHFYRDFDSFSAFLNSDEYAG